MSRYSHPTASTTRIPIGSTAASSAGAMKSPRSIRNIANCGARVSCESKQPSGWVLAIVASFRQRGVTPKGGVPFEQVWTYVFRARDGLIVEMWAFSNRDEAHEKAAAIR